MLRLSVTEQRPNERWEIRTASDAQSWIPDRLLIASVTKWGECDGVMYDYNLEYRLPEESKRPYHRVITAETLQEAICKALEYLEEDCINVCKYADDYKIQLVMKDRLAGVETSDSFLDSCVDVRNVFSAIEKLFEKKQIEICI